MNYADNSSDDGSYYDNDYSVSNDRMPTLRKRHADDSSNDDTNDNSVSTGDYGSRYDTNNKTKSHNNESFDGDCGWTREAKAQDRKAVRVCEDREQRQRSAIIQDIYVCKRHGRERRTTSQPWESIQSRTPTRTSRP